MKIKCISFLLFLLFSSFKMNAMLEPIDFFDWEVLEYNQLRNEQIKKQRRDKFEIKVKNAIKNNTINKKPYLAKACFRGYNDIAKLLINSGADLEKPYEVGILLGLKTALRHASSGLEENIDLVELLLNVGAQIKEGDLIAACTAGRANTVKLLLERGAVKFVNETSDMEYTPLTSAILHIEEWHHKEQYEIVKLLLSYGANPEIQVNYGAYKVCNAYDLAAKKKNILYEHKESFEQLKRFLFEFRDKLIDLEKYLNSQTQEKPNLSSELLEVFFMRLINSAKFENLLKFINAYKDECSSLSMYLKLISKFISNFYLSHIDEISVNPILLGECNYIYNTLACQSYRIAKNKGFAKLGQLIRMACLLNRFELSEDVKRLISSF